MVRDGRLGQAQRSGEVTDAGRPAFVGGDHGQQRNRAGSASAFSALASSVAPPADGGSRVNGPQQPTSINGSAAVMVMTWHLSC